MKRLLFVLSLPLLMSCGEAQLKTYKVEFKSGKIYRVRSTGYWNNDWIHFHGEQGSFPKDSVKSITVENYE